MFLTTESSLAGKNYNALRIIFATETISISNVSKDNIYTQRWESAIENALGKLHANAMKLGADGVIGVHISTSTVSSSVSATVMGTAIKFF